jgi:uncharacterized membrane protein
MAFCPNCGAQASGSFCPNCGTPLTGTAGAGSSGYTNTPPSIQAGGLTDNVASALCYLFGLITGIIFLVLAPYNQNKTVRFHAFQSIFAHIAVIILWMVLGFVGGIFALITHGLGFALFPLVGLLVFILWIYLMISAYQGKRVKLPLVGDLAAKQA